MVFQAATNAMGTRFELVLADQPGAPLPESFLRSVADEVVRDIEMWHARLSRFQAGSVVRLLNQEAVVRPVKVDHDTFELLRLCEAITERSAGAFDVCVARLMDSAMRSEPPPAGGPGGRPITLNPIACTVRLRENTGIDLGAIAKGFALDRAGELLRSFNIPSALLHAGTSSVLAIGSAGRDFAGGPAPGGWPIAIRAGGETAAAPHLCTLRDECLGVSSPSGRYLGEGSDRGHILDPRTGRSSSGVIDTVAVRGPSAALCDAWSTAMLVMANDGSGDRESIGHAPPVELPEPYDGLLHDDASGWMRLPRASCEPFRPTLSVHPTGLSEMLV